MRASDIIGQRQWRGRTASNPSPNLDASAIVAETANSDNATIRDDAFNSAMTTVVIAPGRFPAPAAITQLRSSRRRQRTDGEEPTTASSEPPIGVSRCRWLQIANGTSPVARRTRSVCSSCCDRVWTADFAMNQARNGVTPRSASNAFDPLQTPLGVTILKR